MEDKYKKFWEKRALRKSKDRNVGNLEDNPDLYQLKIDHEQNVVGRYISYADNINTALDLGAGEGFWTSFLTQKATKVVAVDFCKPMLDVAKIELAHLKNKIEFIECSAEQFRYDNPFDLVFISGLFIYLDDQKLLKLMENMTHHTQMGSYFLLRDGTGVPDRYEIHNQYSEALNENYSAIYRTKKEYIELLDRYNFDLIEDENVFPEGHPLNKFEETRLRIFLFKRRE